MITKAEMAGCLSLAVALYPSFPFGEPQLSAYYAMFQNHDITRQEFLDALKNALRESTYFPSVAAINDALKKTPQPKQFDALEFSTKNAVAMPTELKALMVNAFALEKEGEQ